MYGNHPPKYFLWFFYNSTASFSYQLNNAIYIFFFSTLYANVISENPFPVGGYYHQYPLPIILKEEVQILFPVY